jgi:hypothetical protein
MGDTIAGIAAAAAAAFNSSRRSNLTSTISSKVALALSPFRLLMRGLPDRRAT